MIAKATAGDVLAAGALTRLAIPPLRATEEPTRLKLPAGGTLTEQGRAVLDAVAAGQHAPSQGQALLSALADMAKLRENDEHARRLDALEALQTGAEGRA